jgi:CHASE3 domain sensor protein
VAGVHAPSSDGLGYWVNSLFRSGNPPIKADAQQMASSVRSTADVAQEVTGILAHALQAGKLSDDDARHIAQLIAQRTDLSTEQAQEKIRKTFAQVQQSMEQAKQKVKETEEQAKQAVETARKATAHSTLWFFVALLIGAFVASLSATWGGRQRDAR